MKNAKRIIALVLTVLTLVSVMAITASAANTDDTNFYDFDLYYDYWRYLNPRAKENSTPCYVYITKSMLPYTKIRACGTYGATKDDWMYNCTYVNGYVVENVTCIADVKYSIHSLIYEYKYPNASLGFKSGGTAGNNVYGVWSPDSKYTYSDAS